VSQIETVVRGSKQIEKLLKEGFGAQGRGLHEYLSDVENQISDNIVRRARYIASVRNKVIHDDEEIYDVNDFNKAVEEVTAKLTEILESRNRERERLAALAKNGNEIDHGAPRQVVYRGGSGVFKLICALSIAAALWLFYELDNQTLKTAELQKQVKDLRIQLLVTHSEIASLKTKGSSNAVDRSDDYKKEIKELNSKLKLANTELQSLRALKISAQKVSNVEKVVNSGVAEPKPSIQSQDDNGFSNSLLAKAKASGNEYEVARDDILNNFSNVIKHKSQITLGEPEVSQNPSGTYDVRIPVSWSVPTKEALSILNKYFNSYGSKPLSQLSERIKIDGRLAESSTAIKPYTGRLFKDLQKLEFRVVVELSGKSSSILIGSNADCFVGCQPVREPSDAWLIQMDAKPGTNMLSYKDESPIVIKGLTQQDLANAGKPRAYIQ